METSERSTCPEEVKQAVLNILYEAALSIRMAGWDGDAQYCALEADHVHNLPSLLMDYKKEKLRFYLEGERPSYLERLKKMHQDTAPRYEQNWRRLEKHL